MSSIGFGLERIGIIALKRPNLFTVLLLVCTAFCLFNFPQLRFDGDVTAVLPKNSESFRNYQGQKDRFRNFSRDVAVIVVSPQLLTADGLEEIRNLQLELAITEGVGSVYSIFSLPRPNPQTGEMPPFLPAELGDDESTRALIDELLSIQPQAASLISPQNNAALLFVTLESGMHDADDDLVYELFNELKRTTEATLPAGFEAHYSGLTPIGLTIVSAIIGDQIKLTLVGLILGTGIAFFVFRSFLAAFACAIPPALTAIWTLGVFAVIELPINYLTTVLPTLALILAFADSIVLYYRWQKNNSVSLASGNAPASALYDNLSDAILKVGPATALTSITTAIAFLSFAYSSSEALKDFAYLGAVAVGTAFLSVIIGLTLTLYWLSRGGLAKLENAKRPSFGTFGHWFDGVFATRPRIVSAGAIGLVGVLALAHFAIRPEYKVTDYLPDLSVAKKAENLANEVFGGRSMIFLGVPVADPDNLVSAPNRERLSKLEQGLTDIFPERSLASLNLLWEKFETEQARERIADVIRRAPDSARRGYLSSDGTAMLVSIRIPSDQSILITGNQIEAIHRLLAQTDYGDEVVISGFPVLMAEEFTRLIEQLRTSLLIAIFLGIVIVGIATRSPALTLAAITPNLLPILAVEFILYMRGGVINLSEVIALTVAFGIAIDNAVHVINVYSAERRAGKEPRLAVQDSLREIGPALFSSTLIICVSSTVTMISAMPIVPILGQLIIATLIVALISNLAILPANILTISRWGRGPNKSHQD